MELSRRSLFGALAALAAPAIIRPGILMPVKRALWASSSGTTVSATLAAWDPITPYDLRVLTATPALLNEVYSRLYSGKVSSFSEGVTDYISRHRDHLELYKNLEMGLKQARNEQTKMRLRMEYKRSLHPDPVTGIV